MRAHYQKMAAGTDARIAKALSRQIMAEGHRFFGGFLDDNRLAEAKYAVYRVTTMIAGYACPDSAYHGNGLVARRALLGMDFIRRMQRENGLFDYIDCNFDSAPDTAFCLKRMLPALKYLRGIQRDGPLEDMLAKLSHIALKGAKGMLLGGFHTPNHRWAIASVLCECAAFFGLPELAKAAQPYLDEGIDINPDGEYAERSSGNYNRINNDAMLSLAAFTGDRTYIEYALRNLSMMLTYLEPDGSIFTANSTRQDNGKRIFPRDYYWQYLTLGVDENIPEFLDMANTIFDLLDANGLAAPDMLIQYMLRPALIGLEHAGRFSFPDFFRMYGESGAVRARRGDFSYTLLRGKSSFLHFSNRTMDIMMTIGGSVCQHRAFQAESLRRGDGGVTLEQTMETWYYLPFAQPPETRDWWQMDHTRREKRYGPSLRIRVDVKEAEGGIDVRMRLDGLENAPFRVEIACLGALMAEADGFFAPAAPGGCVLAKAGTVTLSGGKDVLTIGPAFGEHGYVSGKFGSQTRDANAFTVYFTDYTPFDRTISIRSGR